MSFAHPGWLGGLWLALVVLGLAAHAQRRRRQVLERFAAPGPRPRLLRGASPRRRWLAAGLLTLSVAWLVVALAGPRYGYRWRTSERRGVDLLVAVDCSRSMLAEDVEPNRLGRAKREVLDLLRRLEGDRIGLVAFAGTAFLQCPLTLDYTSLNLFLKALEPDYLPLGGTALAEAIRTGLASFDPQSAADKALILFTDGEATSGEAEKAAEEAKEQGVQLSIVGVGTPEGAPIPAKGGGFVKDASGGIVLARLGEESLRRLATGTGGTYVRSVAGDEDLDAVYGRMRSELEVKTLESRKVKVWEERYQWPLALAALALAVELGLPLGAGVARALLLAALAGGLALGGTTSAQAAGVGGEVRAGLEHYAAGDYKAAAEAFTRAQVADPTAPELAFNVGSAQYRNGAYEDAYGSFSVALRNAPPELKGEALYNRGNAAFRLGRLEEAASDFQAALEAAPTLEDARLNLAYARQVLAQQQAQKQQQEGEKGKHGQDDQKGEEGQEGADGQQQPPEDSAQQPGSPPEQAPDAGSAGKDRQQARDASGAEDAGDKQSGGEDAGEPKESYASSARQPDAGEPPQDGQPAGGVAAQQSDTADPGGEGQGAPAEAAAAQRARAMLNRLEDLPGRALMPRYQKRRVEKDW
ncbi:MAG: VWA domain-containing protein [Deferrisomatales bacterium]|nr:VWA domain-containing protein [Deferrisomatales bacterium]